MYFNFIEVFYFSSELYGLDNPGQNPCILNRGFYTTSNEINNKYKTTINIIKVKQKFAYQM